MTSKYYCFPDIHGMNELLQKALRFVYDENPEGGKIIFLGDYIDRGPDNLGVLKTIMNPPKNWKFICLMGNHEQMFVEAYRNGDKFFHKKTAAELANITNDDTHSAIRKAMPIEFVEWFEKLKLFHIEDKNVFAHAFYNDAVIPEHQNPNDVVWKRMGDSEQYWNTIQSLFLTHGHTPRSHAPVKAQNRVNLDAGAVYYGRYVIGEYHKDVMGPVAFYEFENDRKE